MASKTTLAYSLKCWKPIWGVVIKNGEWEWTRKWGSSIVFIDMGILNIALCEKRGLQIYTNNCVVSCYISN